jgi:hypothetical protein
MNYSPSLMLKHSFYDRGEFPGSSVVASVKHLQLRVGEHTVFERLPSPISQNYLYIKTKTASKPTDAIYKIVKYFTNTTLI